MLHNGDTVYFNRTTYFRLVRLVIKTLATYIKIHKIRYLGHYSKICKLLTLALLNDRLSESRG